MSEQQTNETNEKPADKAGESAPDPRLSQLETELGEARKQIAALTSERDEIGKSAAKFKGDLEALTVKHTEVTGQLGKLVNTNRERDLLDHLAATPDFKHADRFALHGVVIKLAEEGKAARYPEDPKKAAADLVPLLKELAPTLTRAPGTSPTGITPSRPSTQAKATSVWDVGSR